MVYKNMDMFRLLQFAREKALICFGAGTELEKACKEFSHLSFFESIDLIADNDMNKSSFSFLTMQKPVYSIERCLELAENDPVILVTIADCFDVLEQLDAMPELGECYCFIISFVKDYVASYDLQKGRAQSEPLRIPKIIHYCWFGGEPMRDDFLWNIQSWKKCCPDYEIIRWDESNYDYKKNNYMCEAYKHKKWGFVTDYARLDIIRKHGGVYFDVDVELIRNIDDLLCNKAFCGFYKGIFINFGSGFGAVPDFPIIKELMKVYDKASFLKQDRTPNNITNIHYETPVLLKFGLKQNNNLQEVAGMTVYPSDVLSPRGGYTGILNITNNTYSIHHYAVTWQDEGMHSNRDRLFNYNKLLAERCGFNKKWSGEYATGR